MPANEFIKPYKIGESNFKQATLSEVKVTPTQATGVSLSDLRMFESPIYFVMGWVLLTVMLSAILKVARTEVVGLETLHQVPCRNCRFFSGNSYLKCAVQPCIALTEKANNCSDYWPEKR